MENRNALTLPPVAGTLSMPATVMHGSRIRFNMSLSNWDRMANVQREMENRPESLSDPLVCLTVCTDCTTGETILLC